MMNNISSASAMSPARLMYDPSITDHAKAFDGYS
jgi:hypothetical protein